MSHTNPLDAQVAIELPQREMMRRVNININVPVIVQTNVNVQVCGTGVGVNGTCTSGQINIGGIFIRR